jgi:hypothetical protein
MNSNNSSDSSYTSSFLLDYVGMGLNIYGCLANFVCILVFIKILTNHKSQSRMFDYLLLKSIIDFLTFFLNSFKAFSYFFTFSILHSYSYQIYYKYCSHFLMQVLKLSSYNYELLATIDCYLFIKTNKYLFIKMRKKFKLFSFLSLILVFVFYFGKLFVYKIVSINDNSTLSTYYITIKTPLYYNDYYKTISILYFIFRDFSGSILLILFNTSILFEFFKLSQRKKRLKVTTTTRNDRIISDMKRIIKMIIFSSMNFIILHAPEAAFSVYGKYSLENKKFWLFYSEIGGELVNLSYATPLIIYASVNNVFKSFCLDLLKCRRSRSTMTTITPTNN